MDNEKISQILKAMDIGSWIRVGNALCQRISSSFWITVPLEKFKQGFGLAQTVSRLGRINVEDIRHKINNPTSATRTSTSDSDLDPNNPGANAGVVSKPHFQIEILEPPLNTPGKASGFKVPAYLRAVADVVDQSKNDQAKQSFRFLLSLLSDYQKVIERMPDWVFTAQTPSPDAVACGSSSVWPIDADREYAANPIEANGNRRHLADFILKRIGFDKPESEGTFAKMACTLVKKLAYEGAQGVGQGPPENELHGLTCGEAIIRSVVKGLLKIIRSSEDGGGQTWQ